jgi:hypothetical protein
MPDTGIRLVVLGGSHCKRSIDYLRENGYEVIDLAKPGWLPTDKNVKEAMQEIEKLGDQSNTMFICDLVSNITYRVEQLDGQQLLATKSDGRYHLTGKVTTVAKNLLSNILFNLRPLLNMMTAEKILLSPLPRYLFSGCCSQDGHCEGVGEDGYALELFQKSLGVRKNMRDNVSAHHSRVTVPELYDAMFPEATSAGKVLECIRHITDSDGVHLTMEGYRMYANAIIQAVKSKVKADETTTLKQKQYFWRGFVSPVGAERPKNMAAYHPNKTMGSGKWRRGSDRGNSRGWNMGPRGGRGRPPYHKKPY